ncbi:MAG: hypothetical protein DWQ44_03915 [Bacteroidetes bacterium]|nr:MAG: hypothetical protein DWQ33_03350 [Bacteroidota bacterium]REK00340.1 MAG: hypothetical protein DWQ39_11810 [Bacteroidota bacterium]REK35459.1 MAG: hypothetical protein DWQ44_03915 [Bacteroidota bacterium]REK46857.1 MAG: hypothetical protein DWQ48_13975 [Bacteroidota bacterium]
MNNNSDEQISTASSKAGLKQMFFILWTMGENFPAKKTFTSTELSRHESYLRQAFREGKLLMAALFENGSGIITLVEAENEIEVQKFVRTNPDVVDKKLSARIKACKPVYWKNYQT